MPRWVGAGFGGCGIRRAQGWAGELRGGGHGEYGRVDGLAADGCRGIAEGLFATGVLIAEDETGDARKSGLERQDGLFDRGRIPGYDLPAIVEGNERFFAGIAQDCGGIGSQVIGGTGVLEIVGGPLTRSQDPFCLFVSGLVQQNDVSTIPGQDNALDAHEAGQPESFIVPLQKYGFDTSAISLPDAGIASFCENCQRIRNRQIAVGRMGGWEGCGGEAGRCRAGMFAKGEQGREEEFREVDRIQWIGEAAAVKLFFVVCLPFFQSFFCLSGLAAWHTVGPGIIQVPDHTGHHGREGDVGILIQSYSETGVAFVVDTIFKCRIFITDKRRQRVVVYE